jgi:hypothetical protein
MWIYYNLLLDIVINSYIMFGKFTAYKCDRNWVVDETLTLTHEVFKMNKLLTLTAVLAALAFAAPAFAHGSSTHTTASAGGTFVAGGLAHNGVVIAGGQNAAVAVTNGKNGFAADESTAGAAGVAGGHNAGVVVGGESTAGASVSTSSNSGHQD